MGPTLLQSLEENPEIHRLDPMDLKIYTLAKNLRLWLNSWQNLQIFAKIMSVNAIPGLGQTVRVGGGGGRRLIEVQRGGGGRRADAFPLLPDVEKQGRSRISSSMSEN